jgi:uncharacterized membrane protein YphA (DoxX/SURF4 family)/peroxiredoxin
MSTISKAENIILWTIRILVGVLFILSGFSKLIDPHGLEYKMQEFCEVLGWGFFSGHALLLSVCMISFEIIAGFALLIGYRFRLFSFLLLLLTLFFTFLTAYALFSDKIKECGCFGDCIKLTNTETFWKDVVLTFLIIYIFIRQKFITSIFGNGLLGTLLLLLVSIAAFGSQIWVLKHGALIDCLPYKLGNNLPEQMKEAPFCIHDSVDYKFVYTKGSETKKLGMNQLTEVDSTWTFTTREETIIRKGNCDVKIKDFRINSYDETDITQEILQSPTTIVLYIAKNIAEADAENIERLKTITDKCNNDSIKVIGCSASSAEETAAFKAKHQLNFDFNIMDATTCKTMLRTNSGILILKKGTVQYKCSSPDYPTYQELPLR